MDYEELLDLSVDLAYQVQQCGAETYRVEETILRILSAYDVKGEAFAIPNCIFVSLETPEGKTLTRMRRAYGGSNDTEGMEQYMNLCRKICATTPSIPDARQLLDETARSIHHFPQLILYLGYFIASFGFSLFSGGSILDAFCAGLSGLAMGLVLHLLGKLQVNLFFKTVAAGFALALVAHLLAVPGWIRNPDQAAIGALMLQVPGLLFTNSIRDIIYGDTMSGVNRLVQVFIIAIALAVGTGAAISIVRHIWGETVSVPASYGLLVECLATAIGSFGVCVLFNVRGPGVLLCLIGGQISFLIYELTAALGISMGVGFFLSAAIASTYAELMARVRKCPATSYLLPSLFPLVPGTDIYYTMDFAIRGDMEQFLSRGLHTITLAGCLAIGVLLSSTAFRMWRDWKAMRKR